MRPLRRCSLNQASERDEQLNGEMPERGTLIAPYVFTRFLDVPWSCPLALRRCPVIAMAPRGGGGGGGGGGKLHQFLAVNSWKRRIAVSTVVLAMTAVLASQTTPRPNRITQETEPRAGGDTLGNRTSAGAARK